MRIMVVEDDRALSLFLQKSLEMDGFKVECIADGAKAMQRILEQAPDLLVLDLGLPGMDGLDVLRGIQGSNAGMAILILSGRADLAHRIECLNLGADDYVTKPFSLHELSARCRALRRRQGSSSAGILQHGRLTMDRLTRSVTYASQPVELTTKEFTLLEYLLQQRGRAVSRQELLREVWRMVPDAGTNVVDVYVNYLRRKLGLVGATSVVETVRGEGYAIGIKAGTSKATAGELNVPVFVALGVA